MWSYHPMLSLHWMVRLIKLKKIKNLKKRENSEIEKHQLNALLIKYKKDNDSIPLLSISPWAEACVLETEA